MRLCCAPPAHNPEVLRHVEALVDDLRTAGVGDEVIPRRSTQYGRHCPKRCRPRPGHDPTSADGPRIGSWSLRDFQLHTVDHVIARMFHPDPAQRSMRFLVADEVGLGKTYVAKGVIAETVARLQDEVDRIDVVYVCSNAQIARQNMRRINPLAQQMDLADRLTLLPSVAHDLSANRVNMISLTPGTSLNVGQAAAPTGSGSSCTGCSARRGERDHSDRRGSIELLRVGKGAQVLPRPSGTRSPKLDPVATAAFLKALDADPRLQEDFDRLDTCGPVRSGSSLVGACAAR